MYRTHFLSKDLQNIGEYKHYAAILSHLKNKSKTEYYYMQFAIKKSTKTTLSKLGNLLVLLLKGKPKVKLSPRESLTMTGLLLKKRTLPNYSITSCKHWANFSKGNQN